MLIILLITPSAYAWKFETHQNIIETIYINLPQENQQSLNLTKLKEGSIIPDKDFKDNKKHHYPYSLTEAQKWLNNDTDLSINLGIASHYITDSFVAPHNIKKESYNLHSMFENQVKSYYPMVNCNNQTFTLIDLSKGVKNSKDWYVWLKTKDKKIPEKEVDEGAQFLFSIILNKLSATCKNLQAEVKEIPYFTANKIIFSFIVLSIGLYFLKN